MNSQQLCQVKVLRTVKQLEKTERKLVRPDVTLHYQVWGRKTDALPLVLVHGWAGSVADWQALQPYLDDSAGLAYDAAGFGGSQFASDEKARQADFSIERYVEDLRAILEAEGYDRIRLVGHSWGGVIAMSFAARYPKQVESLVAIGAAYFDPANRLHLALKWASYLIGWLLIISKGWLRRSARLRRWAIRRYFYRQPDAGTTERLIEEVLSGDNRAIIQTLLAGYEVQFKTICPQIECPTLYIGCDKDVVAPLAYIKPFVPLTPQSRYEIFSKCGHFPMLEQPEELNLVLRQFWDVPISQF